MKRTTITIWTLLLVTSIATGTLWSKQKKGRDDETSLTEESDEDDDGGLPDDKRLIAIYKVFIIDTLKVAKDYEKAKNNEGARTCYEQILKLVPNHPNAKKALELIEEKELSKDTKKLNINANEGWQDTGIDLIEGKPILITAEGTWTFKISRQLGPKGMEIPENLKEFNLGSLVGTVRQAGSNNADVKPFSVGEELHFKPEQEGRLYLRMYDPEPEDNSGRMSVVIKGTFTKGK